MRKGLNSQSHRRYIRVRFPSRYIKGYVATNYKKGVLFLYGPAPPLALGAPVAILSLVFPYHLHRPHPSSNCTHRFDFLFPSGRMKYLINLLRGACACAISYRIGNRRNKSSTKFSFVLFFLYPFLAPFQDITFLAFSFNVFNVFYSYLILFREIVTIRPQSSELFPAFSS